MKVRLFQVFVSSALVFALALTAFADTIRLKDGSVIRGQIIGFKDQQFTILVGGGTKNRKSKISIYMEDVDSIEFDNADLADNSGNTAPPPATGNTTGGRPNTGNSTPPATNTGGRTNTNPGGNTVPARYLTINSRVVADNTNNGWTNTGIVLRRGQRVRISANGTISLGRGANSTAAGLPSLRDAKKLMPNEATGGLIAVIGDDNDDFIFIGRNREFVAQRDGVLFLGVNEDNLNDNSGAFETTIEVDIR
jgi:hypothetical protein